MTDTNNGNEGWVATVLKCSKCKKDLFSLTIKKPFETGGGFIVCTKCEVYSELPPSNSDEIPTHELIFDEPANTSEEM